MSHRENRNPVIAEYSKNTSISPFRERESNLPLLRKKGEFSLDFGIWILAFARMDK